MANDGDYENMSSENVKKISYFSLKTLLIYRIKHTLYDMYKIHFNVILITYQMKRIKIKHLIIYITRSRCCIFVHIPTSIEIRRKYITVLRLSISWRWPWNDPLKRFYFFVSNFTYLYRNVQQQKYNDNNTLCVPRTSSHAHALDV